MCDERMSSKKRIGGDFEIDIKSLQSKTFNNKRRFVLQYQYHFSSGRAALYSLANNLKEKYKINKVILPIFACPSIINAFSLSGLRIHFYGTGQQFLQLSQLPSSLEDAVFFYIDYFGFANKQIDEYLSTCPKSNTFIIQDCVQSCFSRQISSHADFVLHSFRKFTPIIDLATIESRFPLSFILLDPDEKYISQTLLSKILRATASDEALYLSLYESAQSRLDILARQPSLMSQFIFDRIDFDAISEQRRKNWNELSSFFCDGSLSHLANPLFDKLSINVVPRQFPIKVPAKFRTEFRNLLRQKHIYCPIHWTLQNSEKFESDFPIEYQLSREILSLPVDQRIDNDHFTYYKETLLSAFSNCTDTLT